MMKCVFSLIALLHLCNTITLDLNLNIEIIKNLDNLTKLYKEGQIDISSPDEVQVPSWRMCKHAAECVKVFHGELQALLSDKVTVHNNSEDALIALEILEANLAHLKKEEFKTGPHCNMIPNQEPLEVFNKYAHFIKKLNTSNNTSTTTNQ